MDQTVIYSHRKYLCSLLELVTKTRWKSYYYKIKIIISEYYKLNWLHFSLTNIFFIITKNNI